MTICKQRRGFTLVELLVVVAIIGILAGLIMVGGSAAFRSAREAATRMEMTNLERALEMYKTKYGEYPPDFSDYDAFVRHFKKRWPRVDVNAYLGDTALGTNFQNQTKAEENTKSIQNKVAVAMGITPTLLAQAPTPTDPTFDYRIKLSAIAFWLGGLPDPNDPTALAGFGPSDNPFCFKMLSPSTPDTPLQLDTGANGVFTNDKLREKTQYDFSVALRNLPDAPTADGYRCLISGKPVVYFRGTTLTTRIAKTIAYLQIPLTPYDPAGSPPNVTKHICIPISATDEDEATPYALKTASSPTTLANDTIDWHNANSFQLIHPGADGRFSAKKTSGASHADRDIAVTDEGQEGLTAEDLDNITNCGSAATVQGIIGK